MIERSQLERELRGSVYLARARVARLFGAWPDAAKREPWQTRSIEQAVLWRENAEQRALDEGIDIDAIPTIGAAK